MESIHQMKFQTDESLTTLHLQLYSLLPYHIQQQELQQIQMEVFEHVPRQQTHHFVSSLHHKIHEDMVLQTYLAKPI